MAAKLAVGVGTVALLVVLAGVLLFTVGRDAANQAAGEWLIRQATNDQEYALVTHVTDVARYDREHPSFACAGDGIAAIEPNAIAASFEFPDGEWALVQSGQSDGTPFAIYSETTEPPGLSGYFPYRHVEVGGRGFTCMVPPTGILNPTPTE